MDTETRLRFAPSPTGPLHIGGIRTALYNYLFARKMGGKFILRIEDTDQGRFVPGAEKYIEESLEWVGLIPDEGPSQGGPYGPYRQSERKQIYNEFANQLIDKGEAYYAFDTGEEIENLRNSGDGNQKYDYQTRMAMQNSLTLAENIWKEKIRNKDPYVIRLKVPKDTQIHIEDAVRGSVHFQTSELDDKILIKSDGMPTYHMANVVDDHLMKISHVIRGEEWLSSTAHHVLLYRAFGWEETMPVFAHLPLILKPFGNGKLSKRDGAQFGFPVFPIDWKTAEDEIYSGFREYGFEPEALLNFLALLGWNDGSDQELFTLEEMIEKFSIEKIVKSGARFDFEKGKWFNQQTLLKKSQEEMVSRIVNLFEKNQITVSLNKAMAIYHLYKDRVYFAKDYISQAEYLVAEKINFDQPAVKEFLEKKWKAEWKEPFLHLAEALDALNNWDRAGIETCINNFAQEKSLKMGEVWPSMRVFVSGLPTGPDALSMLENTGQQATAKRMKQFLQRI